MMSRPLPPVARFRIAVLSGLCVVAAGAGIMGIRAHSSFAASVWGAMDTGGPSLSDSDHSTASSPDEADRSRSSGRATRHAAAVPLNRRSICVRLCDGFAFPVGAYHGDGEKAAHEATCRSECPGAQTALYVVPSGSDSIGDAVSVEGGKNYSALPVAFRYTTVLSDACTCHPAGGGKVKSLLHDFTLRRGDAVMTAHGLKIFHGGGSYPYRPTDFVALAQSPDVRREDLVTFREIEEASVKSAKKMSRRSAQVPPGTRAVGSNVATSRQSGAVTSRR